ncbi:MAG: hypothetical protein IGQ45_15620 [Cyanobacterium sp. T60_A2020_053]|nr:hypothetical protein [Cyanobacterium sp. T60_A2020_053]
MVNNNLFFIAKVFLISAVVSFFIKYVLSNFNLLNQTDLALPIVLTPTVIFFVVLMTKKIREIKG